MPGASPRDAPRRPATEWSWVASNDSSRESSGRIVGSRRASIVLPAPGDPTIRRLWPPAAATSRARRACVCPRTSDRSTVAAAGTSSTGVTASTGDHVPRRKRTASANVSAPTTRSPSTCAASTAFAAGTTIPSSPALAAAIATVRMPGVDSSSPFNETSPAKASAPRRSFGTCPVAASTLITSGRSSPGPSLRTFAGARFTTTRRSGHSSSAPSTAGRTRSRASWTAAPGSPVTISAGSPRPTCASTVTRCPPTPSTATPRTRPYMGAGRYRRPPTRRGPRARPR